MSEEGRNLCFTLGDQFIFQPSNRNCYEIYDYAKQEQQFCKSREVQFERTEKDETLFPCQFIKILNILSIKFDKQICIFKIKDDSKYELIQVIEFNSVDLFGRLTDDGKYLITREKELKKTYIRQLIYLE